MKAFLIMIGICLFLGGIVGLLILGSKWASVLPPESATPGEVQLHRIFHRGEERLYEELTTLALVLAIIGVILVVLGVRWKKQKDVIFKDGKIPIINRPSEIIAVSDAYIGNSSLQKRLSEVEQLRTKGSISEEEYERIRRRIQNNQ